MFIVHYVPLFVLLHDIAVFLYSFFAELLHTNVRACVIRNSFLIKKFIFNYFCVFFVLLIMTN